MEPCSLAFCVSHVAVRVHVLDAGFFLTVSPDSIAVGSSCSILADNRLCPSLVSCCSSSCPLTPSSFMVVSSVPYEVVNAKTSVEQHLGNKRTWRRNCHEVRWFVRLSKAQQWWCHRRRGMFPARFYEGPRRTSGFLCSHCIAQSTALYQFSFANDAPQFPDAERDPVQRLSLSFATAIVVTAGSTFVSGRMAKLERVFHENGIHVIGMQEGRASNDGRLTGAHSEISQLPVRAQPSPSGRNGACCLFCCCALPESAHRRPPPVPVRIRCVTTLWFAMLRTIKAQWKRELPSMS